MSFVKMPRRSPLWWTCFLVILVGVFVLVRNVAGRQSGLPSGGALSLRPVSMQSRPATEPDYAAFLQSFAGTDAEAASPTRLPADGGSLVQRSENRDAAEDRDTPPSEFGLSAPIVSPTRGSGDDSDNNSDNNSGEESGDEENKDQESHDEASDDEDTDNADEDRSGPIRINPMFHDQPEGSEPSRDRQPRRLPPVLDDDAGRLPPPRRIRSQGDRDRDVATEDQNGLLRIDDADILDGRDALSNNRRDDDAPAWELSLVEAIATGLSRSPNIEFVKFDPAIGSAFVGIERGVFDPVGGMSFFGGQDDRQVRSLLDTFGAPVNFQDTDFFTTNAGPNNFFVRQQLGGGGSYEFGFGTDYRRFDPSGIDLFLPSGWESAINFRFDQPLLRGRGRAVAMRRLLVAKAQTQQADYETQAEIREVVRDIELAYWQLCGAYARLKVASKFVELGDEFGKQEDERQELGLSARPQKLQTQSLLSDFRVSLQQARRDANVAEMRLRTAMGTTTALYRHASLAATPHRESLPIRVNIDDSVMPVDIQLDPAIAKAMRRPVFAAIAARQQVARYNLRAARNGLLPQLDATARYSKFGLDQTLNDSVSELFNERFDGWAVGLTYEQPAYQRSAKAGVRRFRLTLAQEQVRMERLSNQVAGDLARHKFDIEGTYEAFLARREQVDFLSQQVEALNELYKDDQVSLFQRLEITRSLQAAEIETVESWTQMQQATAEYRYTRGDMPGDYGVAVDGCGT